MWIPQVVSNIYTYISYIFSFIHSCISTCKLCLSVVGTAFSSCAAGPASIWPGLNLLWPGRSSHEPALPEDQRQMAAGEQLWLLDCLNYRTIHWVVIRHSNHADTCHAYIKTAPIQNILYIVTDNYLERIFFCSSHIMFCFGKFCWGTHGWAQQGAHSRWIQRGRSTQWPVALRNARPDKDLLEGQAAMVHLSTTQASFGWVAVWITWITSDKVPWMKFARGVKRIHIYIYIYINHIRTASININTYTYVYIYVLHRYSFMLGTIKCCLKSQLGFEFPLKQSVFGGMF